MMPHEPVLDIMRRTMANLSFVEQHASKDGPYEVTQLINSFLGALAHPWESLKPELRRQSLETAQQEGWPIPAKEKSTDDTPNNLGDLIRRLRNGVAHGNVSFLPGPQGNISAIRIESRDLDGRRNWGTIVTPNEMKQFLERFFLFVEDLHREEYRKSDRIA